MDADLGSCYMEVGECVPAARTLLANLPRHVFKEMRSGAWHVHQGDRERTRHIAVPIYFFSFVPG